METKIQALHFEATQALEQFINKKIDRLVRKYPAVQDAMVTLRVVKPETSMNKEAKIIIVLPQHPDQVSTKIADSFEEAVDLAIAALEPQLEKAKDC